MSLDCPDAQQVAVLFHDIVFQIRPGISPSGVGDPAYFMLFFVSGFPQVFRPVVGSDVCRLWYLVDDSVLVFSTRTCAVFLVTNFFVSEEIFCLFLSTCRRSYVESKVSAAKFLLAFNWHEVSPSVKRWGFSQREQEYSVRRRRYLVTNLFILF